MPNNCTITCLCHQEYDEETGERADLSPLESMNLCKEVLPMPDALFGIVAASKLYKTIDKATGKVVEVDFPKAGEHEKVFLEPAEIAELERTYGAASWYEWCRENWGTKWGTYDLKVHVLGGDGSPVLIEFQTAWAAPNPKTMGLIESLLEQKFRLGGFQWKIFDPYDDQFSDIKVLRS